MQRRIYGSNESSRGVWTGACVDFDVRSRSRRQEISFGKITTVDLETGVTLSKADGLQLKLTVKRIETEQGQRPVVEII